VAENPLVINPNIDTELCLPISYVRRNDTAVTPLENIIAILKLRGSDGSDFVSADLTGIYNAASATYIFQTSLLVLANNVTYVGRLASVTVSSDSQPCNDVPINGFAYVTTPTSTMLRDALNMLTMPQRFVIGAPSYVYWRLDISGADLFRAAVYEGGGWTVNATSIEAITNWGGVEKYNGSSWEPLYAE